MRTTLVRRWILRFTVLLFAITASAGDVWAANLSESGPRNAEGSTDAQRLEASEPATTNFGTVSYRDDTLLVDGIGAGLALSGAFGVAAVSESRTDAADNFRHAAGSVGLAGVAVLTLGAPVVHSLHRRPGAAGGSLLLRLTLPSAGILSGFFVAYERDEYEPEELRRWIGAGALLGWSLAIAIDAFWLARAEIPTEPMRGMLALVPVMAPRLQGVGLAGTF